MWILDCVALYLNPRVDLLFLQGFRVFVRFVLFLLVVHFDSRRDSSITGRTKRVSVRDNGSALSLHYNIQKTRLKDKQAYDLCSYPKDSLLHLPTYTHTHTHTHTKPRQTGECEAAEILPAPSGTNPRSPAGGSLQFTRTRTHREILSI